MTSPRETSARIDRLALDEIAYLMGEADQWNGGDICEAVADMLILSGRPSPDRESWEFKAVWDKYLSARGETNG